MSTEGFSPWENEYLHCHAEKMPNNAGNEGRVASSFQVFVFHHTVVCEFMTALIKHNSLTPSALIHPYIRALLPLNVTVGTKHFSLYSSSSNTRTFWMLLDPKWLTWSLETRVWIPRSLYFVIWALEKVKWVYFALATVGNSSGDNNHACHFCRLRHTLWDKVSLFS